jgi:hypothetical protein
MSFPSVPDGLRVHLEKSAPGFWAWLQDFKSWMSARVDTAGDVTFTTAAKGIVLKNAAGTVTKRVRLNNAGDGLIYEDL